MKKIIKKANKTKSEKKTSILKKKKVKDVKTSLKKNIIKNMKSEKISKKIQLKKKKAVKKKTVKDVKKPLIKKQEKNLKQTKPETEANNKISPLNITIENQAKQNMNLNPSVPFFTILFVCTGNMCRSPIAEGIMRKKIEEEFNGEEKDFINIHSCGIYAYDGNKPSENALKISKQNNTDISYIRSKTVNKLMIDESDVIFALSVEHLNFIHDNYFSAKSKTFLLKLYGENRLPQMSDSIPDPMGFTIEYYGKTFAEIKNAIDKIFPQLKEMIIKKLQNKN